MNSVGWCYYIYWFIGNDPNIPFLEYIHKCITVSRSTQILVFFDMVASKP